MSQKDKLKGQPKETRPPKHYECDSEDLKASILQDKTDHKLTLSNN